MSVQPYWTSPCGRITIYHGKSEDVLTHLPENSIDTLISDPPYEISFMQRKWDGTGIAFKPELWAAALRVLKPGAMLLSFGGTRTYHRMTCAVEDAGFEIRDCLAWVYGSGFPKSMNISKAMDVTAGAVEEWDGWGTALKPAFEPIVLAMKPLDGTYVENALEHGVAGLNIDGARISGEPVPINRLEAWSGFGQQERPDYEQEVNTKGRWPANLLLDEDAAEILDEQTGTLTSGKPSGMRHCHDGGGYHGHFGPTPLTGFGDSGGASRFFYVAKPSRKERDAGLESLDTKTGGELTNRKEGSAGLNNPRAGAGRTSGGRNTHPTVKPIALMKYLAILTRTPTGGTLIDPFMGSGTTIIGAIMAGRKAIGIDMTEEYCELTKLRCIFWLAVYDEAMKVGPQAKEKWPNNVVFDRIGTQLEQAVEPIQPIDISDEILEVDLPIDISQQIVEPTDAFSLFQ